MPDVADIAVPPNVELLFALLLLLPVMMWGTLTLIGTCTFSVCRGVITARGNSVTLPGLPVTPWIPGAAAALAVCGGVAVVDGLEIRGCKRSRSRRRNSYVSEATMNELQKESRELNVSQCIQLVVANENEVE